MAYFGLPETVFLRRQEYAVQQAEDCEKIFHASCVMSRSYFSKQESIRKNKTEMKFLQ
jgi:hypothetical protein